MPEHKTLLCFSVLSVLIFHCIQIHLQIHSVIIHGISVHLQLMLVFNSTFLIAKNRKIIEKIDLV